MSREAITGRRNSSRPYSPTFRAGAALRPSDSRPGARRGAGQACRRRCRSRRPGRRRRWTWPARSGAWRRGRGRGRASVEAPPAGPRSATCVKGSWGGAHGADEEEASLGVIDDGNADAEADEDRVAGVEGGGQWPMAGVRFSPGVESGTEGSGMISEVTVLRRPEGLAGTCGRVLSRRDLPARRILPHPRLPADPSGSTPRRRITYFGPTGTCLARKPRPSRRSKKRGRTMNAPG